ncbi:MAG: hypothetical protein EU539_10395 [Promethearchaeota archaeon]|nr:MAG: hypothetical protein EU539_10395 [Candidatus Lokiarchaeota archaeon]
MIESIDLITLLLIILIVAVIGAIANFIIGVFLTLKMASLRGLTEEKKPAIILNAIWSLVVLLTGFSPWTYIIAFFINLIIGLIALKYEQFYGLKQFRKRLTFLLIILIIQFVIIMIIYIIIISVIIIFIFG